MLSDAHGLTPWLLERVCNGEAILFLGAGATFGAEGPAGEKPVGGNALRDLLATKFLDGTQKDKPLAIVAEYAKNESSLPVVQTYIRSLFLPLQPAPFHKLIPQFRWHAIITTNYPWLLDRN
jgi:hypothetical protein